MRLKWIATMALTLLPPVAQAGVYKCEQSGRTVYQSTPCHAGQSPHQLNMGVAPNPDPDAVRASRQEREVEVAEVDIVEQRAARARLEHHYTDLAKQGKIAMGMPTKYVIMAWGEPRRINRDLSENLHQEQWVYGNRRYVYIEDDVVTYIQY